ncbi:MAG TPA: hypothetical protein VK546_05350 [Gaiellales bacterium]|nr:hypothetical protein [Gaiellales bacterium]
MVHSRPFLFIAFAFAVMADPVSSVAYAIEAALRALDGRLDLLLPTMALVIGIIALVIVNYWFLVARFPRGGGDAAAAGQAFGDAWGFPPMGALIVDFALTIAISVAAASSAIISYVPGLSDRRLPLALGLCALVAAITWFGHLGRLVFAAFTLTFLVAAGLVVTRGWLDPVTVHAAPDSHGSGHAALAAVVLAFPVAMALATGVEAPLTAIAQLGQLGDRDRRRFGRGTLALTIAIVGLLTLSLTALAAHLGVGIPASGATQIADVARAAAGDGATYALFQASSAILLLSAASSSFAAGPGLLRALSRTPGNPLGILPASFGRTNAHHTPYWAVLAFLISSCAVVVAAGGREQELVLFYAVAVFVSFLTGLLAMARFSLNEGNHALLAVNGVAVAAVGFTLAINLGRGYPLASLAAALLIAGALYALWVRAGRPRGIAEAERFAEA